VTASNGAPSGAKMSSPWCHVVVARGAPNVFVNDDAP
jgi:hypothetical protein